VNDAGCARFAHEVARELLGAEAVVEMPAPLMGAEDFSYVLERVPGALFFLGARPPGERAAPLHSNRMVLEESALATGVALHAALALRWLGAAGAGG
jgi:hippurate hydrolase